MEKYIAVFVGMIVMFAVTALLGEGKSKILIGIVAGTVVAFALYFYL